MTLADYKRKLMRLNVNQAHGRASPHKICMLLAMFDLARSGSLRENRITYSPGLLERYTHYFNAVRSPGDHPNPYFPFFYLQGRLTGGEPSFWGSMSFPVEFDFNEGLGSVPIRPIAN